MVAPLVVRTYRSTSGLEESKHKVDKEDGQISKRLRIVFQVEPDEQVDHEETSTRPKETNGQNCRRVERVAKLAVDDVAGGIGRHKDRVHFTQEQ